MTIPTASKVPGSLAGTGTAATIVGGFGDIFIDDLQVEFIIRATQAHRDSIILTAPKITVLSGESAVISVTTYQTDCSATCRWSGKYFRVVSGVSGQGTTQPQYLPITSGPQLTVTPTITQDKKHVLLNITAMVQDFLGLDSYRIDTTVNSGSANCSAL